MADEGRAVTADRVERLDVFDVLLGTELQLGGKVGEASTTGAGDERHGEEWDLQGNSIERRRRKCSIYIGRGCGRAGAGSGGSVLKPEECEAGRDSGRAEEGTEKNEALPLSTKNLIAETGRLTAYCS